MPYHYINMTVMMLSEKESGNGSCIPLNFDMFVGRDVHPWWVVTVLLALTHQYTVNEEAKMEMSCLLL